MRLWDPPHWDPYLTLAFRTQGPYTFTHRRLLKHTAGPSVSRGAFEFEGDLAESWSQPDELTHVFKLHPGRRWRSSCGTGSSRTTGRISGTIIAAV